MFGRKRRERRADTEQQIALEQRQREARSRERRALLGWAKSDYIAGRIQFDEFWPIWWQHDIRDRPLIPMQAFLDGMLREAMELERSRLMRKLVPLPRPTTTTTTKES